MTDHKIGTGRRQGKSMFEGFFPPLSHSCSCIGLVVLGIIMTNAAFFFTRNIKITHYLL